MKTLLEKKIKMVDQHITDFDEKIRETENLRKTWQDKREIYTDLLNEVTQEISQKVPLWIDIEIPGEDTQEVSSGNPYLIKQKRPEIKPTGIFLKNTDIFILKFEYDQDSKQFFENIFFWELNDGRVVIEYGDAHYYSTKEKIMLLPYPTPPKYYDGRGWNSTSEQAAKKYRKYLAEQTDPDRGFKPMLKTNTRPNLTEEKVEGDLE